MGWILLGILVMVAAACGFVRLPKRKTRDLVLDPLAEGFAEHPEVRRPGWNSPRTGEELISGHVFATDRHQPTGTWVKATARVKVAGIHHRKRDVGIWVQAARLAERDGRYYGIELLPEPANPHDPNAIKVVGLADLDGKRLAWHIGYLPRYVAKDISTDLLACDVPIAGELWSIYEGTDNFVDVNVIVLAPPGHSESARRRRAKV
jgi:hypothetical protein